MAGPCRCCCPQIPLVNVSPSATTVKVSPSGEIVWWFDSGITPNVGQLVGDRYFAHGASYSGSTFQTGRLSVLSLEGDLLADSDLTSSNAISIASGNTGFGSAALSSGGVAFVGEASGASNTARLSFWDVDGVYTGTWSGAGLEIVSDISPVGDVACVRMDDELAGTSLHYRWIDSTGTQVGTELASASGGDVLFSGNMQSFGSTLMIGGQFDVNGNGTYQSATDHRYRIYGNSGAPETSGTTSTNGDMLWPTRYGSNSYALFASVGSITKVTTGLTVTRNTISGVTETAIDIRDVKEDSAGNLLLLTNANLYQFPQSGGTKNWSVALTNRRRVAVDANGNCYVWAGDLKKYNSSGTLQWTVEVPNISFGGHVPTDRLGLNRDTSLHVDSSGYIYVTGGRMTASDLG